ncbi:MAG: hypothetical protein KF760_12365 [Candidatus Eremiobacteraeota bacterium]|nr:hypothetical protein [Candidatus Eremiobacteraeota bacterium]MCW5870350.1 hypothetical protein [Candidatus Eremiobacteraeota bacterium]
MTARLGILQKFQAWMMALAGRPVETPEPAQSKEQPLYKLSRLMVAIASPQGRRGGGTQVMVDALNEEQITCKSRELLQEGEKLELAMLLQGVGHVRLPVTVEWVLLSSFGHSAGLHIEHNEQTREIMSAFVNLLQNNSRG